MKLIKTLFICSIIFFCSMSYRINDLTIQIINTINIFDNCELEADFLECKISHIGDNFYILVKRNDNKKAYVLDSNYDVILSTTNIRIFDEFNNIYNENCYQSSKKILRNNSKFVSLSGINIQGITVDVGNDFLDIYESSYLNEVKISNTPNYQNNTFNNNGCVPTSALMYFTYMNKYSNYDFNLRENFPFIYSNNENEINSKIIEIGQNYFLTDNTGTDPDIIIDGLNNYFSDLDYDLNVAPSAYFSLYRKMIFEFKNPCLLAVSLNEYDYWDHFMLGIGYKIIFNGIYSEEYVIANEVHKDGCYETTFKIQFTKKGIYHISDFILIGDIA